MPAPREVPDRRPGGGLATMAVVMAATHGTVDAYMGFLHPLLPRIMEKLGLSITLAATLVVVLSIASSVLQPATGYLADRYGRRIYIAAGPILAGIFASLIGLAPTFRILVLLLVLAGLGAASFHPPGASSSARVSEGRGSGVRLSIFSFGGAVGYAVGPLLAVALVAWAGLEGMWVAMVPGVLIGLALLLLLPREPPRRDRQSPPSPAKVLSLLRGPLGIAFGISAVGTLLQRTYLTFEPIIVAEAGGSEATGAAMLSIYLGAQALGTLASGALTDRVDRRHILVGATILGVPAHILAVLAAPAGPVAISAAVAAGFLNMALLPPLVVMAQEMMPEGTAIGSGIVMGLAWATGSAAVLAAGVLGDQIGPVAAAAWTMPMLLIGTLLAFHPALQPYRRPQQT